MISSGLKVWTLIVTLHYGMPDAKQVVAQENIKTWEACLAAGARFLRAINPPAAVTCQPSDTKA